MDADDCPTVSDSDALGVLLASPSGYPEPTTHIDYVETHISRVYLTDQFAYKLKKPVRFDFLDFSTAELRHQACLAELHLNRRLAPDVYLEVLPVTQSAAGKLQIGGSGETVDWLVKMRRLSDSDTLLALTTRGSITPDQIAGLANVLARFYRQQPSLALTAEEYRAEIERHVRGNQTELLRDEQLFPVHEVRRIHSAQLIYLTLHPEVFDARVVAGRVVDGHGDLRPEHVYLTSPPIIIDCIEFNPEFRTVDVLDELCFLETECAMLDALDVASAVRTKCLALLGDRPPDELAAFYKSYRACVRAKIAVLRARQLPSPAAELQRKLARKYLTLADEFDEALGPPLLLLVCGLSGTGKSTVAQALAERLGIEVLQTDAVRQEMVVAGELPLDPKAGKYSVARREQVYDAMLARADELLAQHSSVILDGTFLSMAQKERVAHLARQYHARWLIVRCHCPVEVAQQRIVARLTRGPTLSEAKPELVAQQLTVECGYLPEWPVEQCETTQPVRYLVAQVLNGLRERVAN